MTNRFCSASDEQRFAELEAELARVEREREDLRKQLAVCQGRLSVLERVDKFCAQLEAIPSLRELGRLTGISPTTLRRYRDGVSPPTLEHALQICAVRGLRLQEVLGG